MLIGTLNRLKKIFFENYFGRERNQTAHQCVVQEICKNTDCNIIDYFFVIIFHVNHPQKDQKTYYQ